MVLKTTPQQVIPLQNINKSGLLDLKECLIAGLQSSPKSMPSLLLWDSQGLRNFDSWTNAATYYPKRREWEILKSHGHDIASQFPSTSVIVELGCGNLSKTAWLLASLARQERHVYYYALDVSDEALYKSLKGLRKQFAGSKSINIAGLSGTYDDCAAWLTGSANLAVSTITFLWLGNSVANMTRDEVSGLMSRLRQACRHMAADCSFLVSADCCTDRNRILQAYDAQVDPSRTFLLHGLHHANQLLCDSVFLEHEWEAVPEWDEAEHELHYSYSPRKDMQLTLGHDYIDVKRGERIPFFMSAKWDSCQVQSMAERAGLRLEKLWQDYRKEYAFYLLQT
ncbi:hypothetical protein XA68_13398 [Ophiocordyceps unilateralis]|uniref:Histidine-specific methyltransferase SAM-dependent domain-containing protein n=1 Tax=Ophiocordyceps unilateralis TaxID=268505 RepID=A0A2A9PAW2_OPHUN|nr:hypothetical protein XA68_13398 [Ophiocordyceps unilateralis]